MTNFHSILHKTVYTSGLEDNFLNLIKGTNRKKRVTLVFQNKREITINLPKSTKSLAMNFSLSHLCTRSQADKYQRQSSACGETCLLLWCSLKTGKYHGLQIPFLAQQLPHL